MRTLFVLCMAATLACGRAADSRTDTAAAAIGATSFGNVTTADDTADRDFLRMMSDHHEGMVLIAMTAMTKGSNASTKGEAHTLHLREAAERDSLLSLFRAAYATSYTPTAPPMDRARNDSLNSLTGAAYDRAFYRTVVEHQREGVAMIDSTLPRLTRPDVKRQAEALKADHEKEIAEFGKKSS